jgi:signal transduction histidine kinase
VTRDGEERHARYSATGVVEGGALVRIWGTVSDVTDRVHLENELRALWAHQADVLDQERTRIAREIHDELGQQLTALKFEAAAFEAGKRTPARGEMTQHVDAAIHTVRRIATELRPAILDHFGLGAAVEWQCTEFSRRTGIECSSHVEPDLTIAPSLATTAFRILQEALTNAARHSGASHIRISLTSAEGMLELVVEDNGQGMGTPGDARPRPGLGMIGMRERALGAGGTLEIVSQPNEGTRVHARFPLGAPAGVPA